MAKSTSGNSKLVNCALGILMVANGLFLAGFVKANKDGVKNYIKRTFAATPANHNSNNNIIADVQKYMSRHREKNLSAKTENVAVSETIFQIARTYQAKGEQSTSLKAKLKNYSLALLELEKLSPQNPRTVKQVKPIKYQIKSLLQPISTVGVKLGDSRDKMELIYGLADKTEISRRHYPIGSIRYFTYEQIGLQFGLRDDRIFAINIRSNFRGIIGGVQIGDDIASIKALYKGGRVSDLPGNNFSYQTGRFTFVFSNQDNLVDGIKLFDRQLHGNWSTTLL
jgi:hypothetical protein